MPNISSKYNPRFPFRNGHFSTIYSSRFRPAPIIIQDRQRLELDDGDFLDLDWSYCKGEPRKLSILLHGLEGHAQRTYIKAQVKVLIESGWDTLAVNYRGCSGEANLTYQSYNAGKTDDLEAVIQHVLENDTYDEIALIGFSLGGNLLLKYLGEREEFPKEIKKAVAISTPLDLKGSLESLNQTHNLVYRFTFLKKLRKKYKEKMQDFPEMMNISDYNKINSLLAFDDIYTAPAHGFDDANDYYMKNSSLQFLPRISIPVYILNSQNDSFLSKNCYPIDLAKVMKNLFLETPKYGGHVGFHQTDQLYYNEARTVEFLNNEF